LAYWQWRSLSLLAPIRSASQWLMDSKVVAQAHSRRRFLRRHLEPLSWLVLALAR